MKLFWVPGQKEDGSYNNFGDWLTKWVFEQFTDHIVHRKALQLFWILRGLS